MPEHNTISGVNDLRGDGNCNGYIRGEPVQESESQNSMPMDVRMSNYLLGVFTVQRIENYVIKD